MEEIPPEVLQAAHRLANELASEDGWSAPTETFAVKLAGASTRRLQEYWETGKGATKVRWGTPGAMQRCIRANRGHMADPGGYCATRHKAVTGQWPTEGGKSGVPS